MKKCWIEFATRGKTPVNQLTEKNVKPTSLQWPPGIGELNSRFGGRFEVARVRERTRVKCSEADIPHQLHDVRVCQGMIADDQDRRLRPRPCDSVGENLREDRIERLDDMRPWGRLLHSFARRDRVPMVNAMKSAVRGLMKSMS